MFAALTQSDMAERIQRSFSGLAIDRSIAIICYPAVQYVFLETRIAVGRKLTRAHVRGGSSGADSSSRYRNRIFLQLPNRVTATKLAQMKTLQEIFEEIEKTGAWYGEKIASVMQRNFMMDTVLHTVCTKGQVADVCTVLAAGADPNAKGDQGATPLFNAVMSEKVEVVKALLAAGSDPLLKNGYGRLVLDYAKNVSAPSEIIVVLESAAKVGRKR